MKDALAGLPTLFWQMRADHPDGMMLVKRLLNILRVMTVTSDGTHVLAS